MSVFAGDSDLLRRFRAGDRDALATVYWFYVRRVEAVVRRGLTLAGSGATRADVADLVQDAFVRAFADSARGAYDGSRDYGPLLTTIARNVVVDHLRRRGRDRRLETLLFEPSLEDAPVGAAEDPWADAQTMALVEEYVSRLPTRERAVYVQRYDQGRSQTQAADALGLTRQEVRTLEGHVRAGLAREIARAKLASRPPMPLRSPPTHRAPRSAELRSEEDA